MATNARTKSAMRLRTVLAALAACGGLVACPVRPAWAQSAVPVSKKGAYSPYEKESLAFAAERLGTELDPTPDGKPIESIDIVALEVIEKRDPAPGFLNAFHVTSRNYVISREVLQKQGEPYVGVLADETARNLRRLPQLSLVIVAPFKGHDPEHVRLVVITKDVWSLRLSWDVAVGTGGLERLVLQPTETNILGTQQTAAVRYQYLPLSFWLGARYVVPRILGSRVSGVAEAHVIFNQKTGKSEGSYGGFRIERPLFSTQTEWGVGGGVEWLNEVTRRYVNARLGSFDSKKTPGADLIPFSYRTDTLTSSNYVTRSFGWAKKVDVTLGLNVSKAQYSTGDLSAYDPVAVADFKDTRVPTSDTRVAPYFQARVYTTNFLRVLDFETLALQEDFRLGHDVWFRVYPVTTALGSTRNFWGFFGAAQYSVPMGDGLARLGVESVTEAEPTRVADASVSVNARLVSPRTRAGRLVLDSSTISRYRNYLRSTTFLGGAGRLRGYPSNFFAGKDATVTNLEFRSRPLEIFSCQVAAVAFLDAGGAFDGWSARTAHFGTGGGVRVLLPQLDRSVFRIDLGVPIGPNVPAGIPPVSFSATFDQAFGVATVGP